MYNNYQISELNSSHSNKTNDVEPFITTDNKFYYGSYLMKIATFLFAILSITFLIGLKNSSVDTSSSSMSKLFLIGSYVDDTGKFDVGIEVVSPGYNTLASLNHLPWDAVAEPSKLQFIKISKLVINNEVINLSDLESIDYKISWNLNDKVVEGYYPSFQIDDTGVYKASVKIINNKSQLSYTHEFKLAVKYIRREIRSLTSADREKFMATLKKLYTTDQTTGEHLYGEKFQSAEILLRTHLLAAGMTDCDHW